MKMFIACCFLFAAFVFLGYAMLPNNVQRATADESDRQHICRVNNGIDTCGVDGALNPQ